MEERYPLRFGDRDVGTVSARREGLYVRFCCRCRLSGGIVCRVVLRRGDGEENLGVLVPEDGGFLLSTRIPAKRLGDGGWEFQVVPCRPERKQIYAPIYPEEPFSYLERLKDAYLLRRDGENYAVIPEPQPDPVQTRTT